MGKSVRAALEGLLAGKEGDETVLDYVVSVVEDEDFPHHDEEEAVDSIGPVLVRPRAAAGWALRRMPRGRLPPLAGAAAPARGGRACRERRLHRTRRTGYAIESTTPAL